MKRHRVLLVDDSRVTYSQLQVFLENTEYEIVRFCRSGEEAVEAYGEVSPDLVLMDIIMRGIDGLETSRRILQKWPDARIVVVSALHYDEITAVEREIGCKGYVEKPIQKESLLAAMRKAME